MEVFPAYAKLKFSGFGKKRQPAVERTEMESGPAKQLQTLSRVLLPRSVTYAFDSAADYANFIAWFTANIHRGTDWFTWTDPETALAVTARIVGGSLDAERPIRRPLDMWEVSFQIETWDA